METDIKFEKALEQLEKIVAALEKGDLALDEALKRYEEGVKLARLCTQKLEHAENKIQMLTKALNGQIELPGEEGAKEKKTPGAKKSKRAADSGDPDFLL